MKTECLINLDTQEIKVNLGHEHDRLLIDFYLDGADGYKYNLENVSFGYRLEEDNAEAREESWPAPGIKFGKIVGNSLLTSANLKLTVDQNYRLTLWCTFDDQQKFVARNFYNPIPFKAFDSMIWNEEMQDWEHPKPYPEDNKTLYVWDENKMDWKPFDES